MSDESTTMTGTIRGRTIELDREPGLPDGQQVSVTLQPARLERAASPAERLKRAFGSWAHGGAELDRFMEELEVERKIDRPELPE